MRNLLRPVRPAALLAAVLLCHEAPAASCRGVEFAPTVEVDGQALALNGLGVRLATFLAVPVYVGALHLAAPTNDPAVALAATGPWRLSQQFLRDVDASKLREAWETGFARNAGQDLPALRARIERLAGWMRDVRAGERLVYTRRAGGVDVEIAGRTVGTIEGEDFARALLAVWLGTAPPNPELKSGLLGGGCE
jgi:hypothetical protein